MKTDRMEVGNIYKAKGDGYFRCIAIVADIAYCIRHYENTPESISNTAYGWNANTGEAISLSIDKDYDLLLTKTINHIISENNDGTYLNIKFKITADNQVIPESIVVEEHEFCSL
jgi:hypothetical protein